MLTVKEAVEIVKNKYTDLVPSKYVEYGDYYIFILSDEFGLSVVMDPWRKVDKRTGECTGFSIIDNQEVVKLMAKKGKTLDV